MLRHCTVIAVKTNITPVSCPTGTVWRQDKSGEDRQGHVSPGRMGVSNGLPGGRRTQHISFCANFTTVYLILNTETISARRFSFFFFFFNPWLFKPTEEVIIRSSDDGIVFLFGDSSGPFPLPLISLLLTNQLSFVFKKAQTLSVSSDIHWNYDCCHMTFT